MFKILVWQKCSKCGETKPATREFFHRASHHKNLCFARCKTCKRKVQPSDEEKLYSRVSKNGSIPEANPELGACWLWTDPLNGAGYGTLGIRRKIWMAHRLSWTLEYGEIPPRMQVCHKCDVRKCLRPSHLFLGTQVDNLADMKRKGRSATGDRNGSRTCIERIPRGELHFAAKATEDAVREIRAFKGPRKAMAAKHGLSIRNVGAIVSRRTWKHVKD